MNMTPEQSELFELIKREFFVDPAPPSWPEYVRAVQAHLTVLIGNMLEWYLMGSAYTPLEDALKTYFDNTGQQSAKPEINQGNARVRADSSPLVIADNWDLSNIKLPFAQPRFNDLKEALPIVDTDTGGAIRFNHHFLGELHPQGNILALAASIVSAFLNENALIPKVSPSVTTWEKEVVKWMWHMLEDMKPSECGCEYEGESKPASMCDFELDGRSGRIVAGGTIANLTAFFIAREEFRKWCAKAGKHPSDVTPVVLYSSHSHYSIRKVARIVGFAYDKDPTRSEVVSIDGSNYWYVTADDVARAIQSTNARGQYVVLVSVLAGATDTGFVDDLEGIADVINEYNESPHRVGPRIYYHIDAAMGGPFRLLSSLTWKEQQDDFLAALEKSRPRKDTSLLFEGIQRGDAITIDGHKYFYCNYPCGGIVVRRENDFDCLHEDAKYLESGESQEEEPEQLRRLYKNLGLTESPLRSLEWEGRDRRGINTLEGSRGIIGITQLYVTLKVFGPEGMKALLQHTLNMTSVLRNLFKGTRQTKDRQENYPVVELITTGPLNQTLFRVVTDWEGRTKPHQIDLDNDINFLIPYYASWTQTNKLRKELKHNREKKERADKDKIGEVINGIIEGHYTIPFYVGTDQPLDHLPDDRHARPKLMDTFLDYVWRINDEDENGHCPTAHKQNVQRWLASVKDPKNPTSKKRSLQVLKAVITHPYTDEPILKKFVSDLCEGASVIRQILEEKGKEINPV